MRIAIGAACLGAAALAQGAVLVNQFGELTTSDPTFSRTSASGTVPNQTCSGSFGPGHFYKTYDFTATGGLPLNIRVSGIEGLSALDTFVEVYTPSFNPGSPLTNCVGANDDQGGDTISLLNSWVQLPAPAAGAYTVVVTSFAAGATGDFRVCVTESTDELAACLEHPKPVPALGAWGLGGLLGLLSLIAGWALRRRTR
ncbi:MAG: hypothetical protein KAX84_02750 [Burkholderiales bacterium]|nr:hypothetical protein [Burkholderiales bacterium]